MISVNEFFSAEILALNSYHVQNAAGFIKLDAMENPYRWPENLIQEWLTQMADCHPNRYPDPQAEGVKALLRSTNRIPDGSAVMMGNGSDELIQILLMAIAGQEASVIAPEPTFVMYRQIAKTLGVGFHGIPLSESDFQLDMSMMRHAIAEHQPRIIFVAYPNNPTGNLFSRADIEELLRIAPGIVVIDEAYTPFAEDSFLEDLPRHPNLLVMRTLSKLGLAGLRLGFMCGGNEWIEQFEKLRLPYNINTLSQVTAEFALKHWDMLIEQTSKICDDRERLMLALTQIPQLTVYPSQANFITFRTSGYPASELFEHLRQQGILIKNLSANGGALTNCLRVTVGMASENDAFLAAVRAFFEK